MTVDLSLFVAPIFTALLTGLGVWVGMSNQVTAIKVEITNLTKQVEKHNSIVERTFKLEADSKTAFMRIDELREESHRIESRLDETARIGGTD